MIIGLVQGALAGLAFWLPASAARSWCCNGALSVLPGIGAALVWVPAVIFLGLDGQVGAAVGVGLWCAGDIVSARPTTFAPFWPISEKTRKCPTCSSC